MATKLFCATDLLPLLAHAYRMSIYRLRLTYWRASGVNHSAWAQLNVGDRCWRLSRPNDDAQTIDLLRGAKPMKKMSSAVLFFLTFFLIIIFTWIRTTMKYHRASLIICHFTFRSKSVRAQNIRAHHPECLCKWENQQWVSHSYIHCSSMHTQCTRTHTQYGTSKGDALNKSISILKH